MYRFDAIILHIQRIRENQTRIVLLTEEYGRLTIWWYKKNCHGLDVGDIVEAVVTRRDGRNIGQELQVRTPSWPKSMTYECVYSLLETLHIVTLVTRDGENYTSIYNDLIGLISIGRSQLLNISHYSMFQMRVLRSIGSMDAESFSGHPILSYIYHHIARTPLKKILSSHKYQGDHIAHIRAMNWKSIYSLTQ